MKKITFTICSILMMFNGYGQDTLDIVNHADCNTMLAIETRKTIGPTNTPSGYGKVLEFKGNNRSNLHFMEKESNTVWYQFETKTKGKLTFEIEPLDSLNDYDFALYKYTDEGFCEAVKNKTILPIRTNFSRNKPAIASKTGLSTTAEKEFISAGVNPAYSKALDVLTKEKYILVVNNVYANGRGHLLHFNYLVNMSLRGEVIDVASKHVIDADVTLTNVKTGKVVAQTTTDTMGTYTLTFDLPKVQLNDKLHLEVSKEGYFFQDTLMRAFDMATKMRGVRLKTKIKKIKKGDSFIVKNILFHGNSAKPINNALPSIKALYKTMKRNKTLKICIEGHTNGCHAGTDFSTKLSNARAHTVENFLLENKIASNRVESIGYGCSRMLFANERGRFAHLNRRVEIKVLDL